MIVDEIKILEQKLDYIVIKVGENKYSISIKFGKPGIIITKLTNVNIPIDINLEFISQNRVIIT